MYVVIYLISIKFVVAVKNMIINISKYRFDDL